MAQTTSAVAPLRTAPTEKFTVNPGFRDWAPTVLAGTTIIGGNSSNRGGLYVQGHPGATPASELQGRIVYQGGNPSSRRRCCRAGI